MNHVFFNVMWIAGLIIYLGETLGPAIHVDVNLTLDTYLNIVTDQVQPFISWNVKGLRSPSKRASILLHLKQLKTDIALLQKTNLGQEDFVRMHRQWVGQVLGSPAVERKAGFLILINKSLQYRVMRERRDDRGRIVPVELTIGERQLSITTVYMPNQQSAANSKNLLDWILAHPTDHHIIGGDFNNVMALAADRIVNAPTTSGGTRGADSRTHLSHMADVAHLTDEWRLHHPTEHGFTHFSQVHRSWLRTDYFFGTDALIPHLLDPGTDDLVISDHAPIAVDYSVPPIIGTEQIGRSPSYLAKSSWTLTRRQQWSPTCCGMWERRFSEGA